ncbi:SusC/RagA family TonB-linked outer membrane protein [Poritiphilus flavus]|uniref:SusC/RagA family TonB-linked outer membrane protein n=1 Tax=Poritiphilus flavus TaxID=2697053 RepID=A0A6L9EE53_9FLAO|nr:TonB-dependent receptor [Poritiphilus flavus]NAS12996.1 SusC/RagA family TonB-linked outer membrane protein [Poritiphilus flavus]
MKLKLFFLMVLSVSSVVLAQTQVTGVVLDEANVPLPSATVLEKGSNNGVVTDFDGNFSITVSNSNATLVISYIGFESREIVLDGSSSYTVQLTSSSTGLDEVVVIGYGAVEKKDLTGAVASLSNETLTEQRKTDIGQALQGRVAGVDVRTLSFKPGAPLSIQVRGNTVITANQGSERDGVSDDISTDPDQPLYVVDGVFFDDINALNPADIEQMDILKDASATAIYGSRGANGVVIISTKSGVEGRTRFTYDATFGLRVPTNVPDFFDGPEYVAFVDDVLRAREWQNADLSVEAYNNVTIDRSTEFQSTNEEASNVANGRYTDWIDLFQRTGVQTSHTVGMSGGKDGLVYNGSLGYLKDEGVIGIEEFERYNLSASLSKKVTEKLTVGVKTYLTLSEREEGSRELFRSTFRLAPTVNPFDANGEAIVFPDDQDLRFPNPVFEDEGAWRVNTKTLNVIANASIDYKANDWLNFRTQFSPNISTSRFGEFRGLLTKNSRNDPSRVRSVYDTGFRTSYTWDNILDFNFDITPDQRLKATLISSLFYDNREGSMIQTRNFDTDAFLFFNTEGGTDIRDFDSFYTKETLASFAGRLNYSIKDRYLFTFTGRYDGSSKLAESNKWQFFPSAAFAWRASEEVFLRDVDWLNNLKLRVSYGESGNDNPVDPYSSLAFLQQANYLFDDDIGLGKIVQTLPNADLTWEVSKEYNVGLDLGILNNRVNLAMEYYRKTTEGSILNRQLSFITGLGESGSTPSSIGNFGSVRNSGVEITLNTVNIQTADFSWRTNINYTKNVNEILELYDGVERILVGTDQRLNGVLQVGAPIDATFDYEVDGIWSVDEAAEASSFGALPGQYKFVDQNGDGVINPDDKVVLGSQSPDWIGGMTNTFNYKNFELNVQVNTRQGVFGHSEWHQNFSTFQGDRAVFNSLDQDYWTPNNQGARYPSPEYGEDGGRPWFYEDMSFVRVGNIGVAYSFPQQVLDKLKLSNLRLSIDLQNPFVFTDFEGPDPETGLQNSYNMSYSIKTFLFGLKLAY